MARFTRKSDIPRGLPKLEFGYNRVRISKVGKPFDSEYEGHKTVRVRIPFQTLMGDAELAKYFTVFLSETSDLTELYRASFEEFDPFDDEEWSLGLLDNTELIVLVENVNGKKVITEFHPINANIETIN